MGTPPLSSVATSAIPPLPSAKLFEMLSPGNALRQETDTGAELMLRVKEGDSISFNQLLQAHRAPVIHFLYRMVQSPVAAEELAQEVFLRVYRSRNSYEPTAKFT